VTDPLPPSIQPDSGGPPEAAVTVGAHAVAKFADRHHIPLAPALREDLARAVLTEAWPHLTASDRAGTEAGPPTAR
jgi:hypothetical protein